MDTKDTFFSLASKEMQLERPNENIVHLTASELFDVLHDFIGKFLKQSEEKILGRFTIKNIMEESKCDEEKLGKLLWMFHESLDTLRKTSKLFEFFAKCFCDANMKEEMLFYWRVYSLIPNQLLARSDDPSVLREVDSPVINIEDIVSLESRILWAEETVFRPALLSTSTKMLLEKYLLPYAKDPYKTTIEYFLSGMISLYEYNLDNFQLFVSSIGQDKDTSASQRWVSASKQIRKTFYRYPSFMKGNSEGGNPSKKINGKENIVKEAPIFSKAKKSEKKKCEIEEGHPLVMELEKKVRDLSSKTESIDQIFSELTKEIEEKRFENVSITKQNEEMKSLAANYMKNPRNFDIKLAKDLSSKIKKGKLSSPHKAPSPIQKGSPYASRKESVAVRQNPNSGVSDRSMSECSP